MYCYCIPIGMKIGFESIVISELPCKSCQDVAEFYVSNLILWLLGRQTWLQSIDIHVLDLKFLDLMLFSEKKTLLTWQKYIRMYFDYWPWILNSFDQWCKECLEWRYSSLTSQEIMWSIFITRALEVYCPWRNEQLFDIKITFVL